MRDIIKYAAINSLGTALYIISIISVIYFFSHYFGEIESVFIPILMLMLFVFSAALTGFLVLGRPIMWYINGKKREALSLLGYTMGIFLVIMIVMFFFLVIFIV